MGFFVFEGRTHQIEEYQADMQDAAELARPVLRRDMRYVNNFLFAPAGSVSRLREEIDGFLASQY